MEQLIHYCWKHRLFPLKELTTTDGQPVEVIDAGLHNHHAGPDFFNAKVTINGTLWVGNVEIHTKSSDWYLHGHDHDPAYNNVVLHVASIIDREVVNSRGDRLPQMQLEVPSDVLLHYERLLSIDRYPRCREVIGKLSPLAIHAWMSALQTERLEQKTQDVVQRTKLSNGSWEDAFFITLARSYGFGVNSEAFETWARHIPLLQAAHHRDDLFQTEALFLGQAGLLELSQIPERYQQEALEEGYFSRLRNEYLFLAHKFSLKPMDPAIWRFLRLRPQNFPHIRISQLVNLYCSRRASLSQLLECESVEQLRDMFNTCVTPYWESHYTFGSNSDKNHKNISQTSLNLLIVNTAIPVLFAYGRHHMNEKLCDRAFSLLEQVSAERNHVTRMWEECGIKVNTAADSQALIQLKKEYCDKKECLRCRFGYEFLKRR